MVEFKESLQYHNFFQKIYSNGNKGDLCFGMGLLVPRVPFLFQTIPEKRAFEFLEIFDIADGDAVTTEKRRQALRDLIYDYALDLMRRLAKKQYECRLDGTRFSSKALFFAHVRNAHQSNIEEMLKQMLDDMEQDHLGNFFTKLFYSDVLYPSFAPPSQIDFEFPCVVAPDLSKTMSKSEKKKKKRKKKRKEQRQKQRGGKNVSRRASSADVLTPKELLQLERKVFGELLADSLPSQEAEEPSVRSTEPTPEIAHTQEDDETRKKREAAIIEEAQNVKQSIINTKNKNQRVPKNGKDNPAPSKGNKPSQPAAKKQSQPTPGVPPIEAPSPANGGGAKNSPRRGNAASDKKASQEKRNPPTATPKKDESQKPEKESHMQLLAMRQLRKEMEEELTAELVEEVVLDLCQKLAARSLQQEKKRIVRKREEEELKAKQEQEAAFAAEQERKKQERVMRREIRRQEADRMLKKITKEVVLAECKEMVNEIFQEHERSRIPVWPAKPVAKPAPVIGIQGGYTVPVSPIQKPPYGRGGYPNVPNARFSSPAGIWMPPVGIPPGGRGSIQPAIGDGSLLPTSDFNRRRGEAPLTNPNKRFAQPIAPPYPTSSLSMPTQGGSHPFMGDGAVDGSGKIFPSRPGASGPGLGDDGTQGAASRRFPPTSMQSPSLTPSSASMNTKGSSFLSDLRGPATGPEDDILHIPFTFDAGFEDTEDSSDSNESADAFFLPRGGSSIFSSPFGYFGSPSDATHSEPKLSLFSDISAFIGAPSPSGGGGGATRQTPPLSSSPEKRKESSNAFDASLPALSPLDPRRALRSVPEDWNLDSSRCIVCHNLPADMTKKPDIANFLQAAGCNVDVDKSLAPMIQFLRGFEMGCCFVQMETDADVKRALALNGTSFGNNFVEITLPVGLQTSESGQKFAFNPQSRNIYGLPFMGREGRSGLNPVAPEFRPKVGRGKGREPPPGFGTIGSRPPGSPRSPRDRSGEDEGDREGEDEEEGGIAMLNTQHDTVVTPDRTKNFGSPGSKKHLASAEAGVRSLRVLAREKVPQYGRLAETLSPSPLFSADGSEPEQDGTDSFSDPGGIFHHSTFFAGGLPVDGFGVGFYHHMNGSLGDDSAQGAEDENYKDDAGPLQFSLDDLTSYDDDEPLDQPERSAVSASFAKPFASRGFLPTNNKKANN